MIPEESVNQFDPISLKDMDSVRLMNRTDTKYVLSNQLLPELLSEIRNDYYSLEINQERVFGYQSLYFDTIRNSMYLAHHNGKVNRYKVRMRRYVANDLCFLEIKRKIKGTRTVKHRRKIPSIDAMLAGESQEYINRYTPFGEESLEAKIYTNFDRITLVNKALNERVTIDTNLLFSHNGWEKVLKNIVIIELKRDGSSGISPLLQALNRHRIFPQGFSKYCIGRAMIEENIKRNNFKERITKINKLNHGGTV